MEIAVGPDRTHDTTHSRAGRFTAVAVLALTTLGYVLTVVNLTRLDLTAIEIIGEALALAVWLFSFAVVGALIAYQRPWNVIGWICLLFALLWSLWSWSEALLRMEAGHPGSVSNPELIAALAYPFWVPGVGLIAYLLLLFPDGHFPSPRWRPLAWILGIDLLLLTATAFFLPGPVQDTEFVNPLGIEAFAPFRDGVPSYVLVVTLIASLAASAVSVAIRFRRSSGVERLQLKWLVSAGVIASVGYATMFIVEFPVQLIWSLIPLAIFFALRRHRLYEIDRLISRTTSYAIVIVLLSVVFAGSVFVLRSLFSSDNPSIVAASTLAIAALFNPLRRRVHHGVDRIFNRSKYDAEQVAETFERSLQTRTDLAEIRGGLAEVITTTMQPSQLGIWMRDSTATT